ncbi:hypothetical protein GGF31_003091 [Allomyces arbusculus]|nr:hypothetical protein GGF31_003091 [Allomyces arbusculus]
MKPPPAAPATARTALPRSPHAAAVPASMAPPPDPPPGPRTVTTTMHRAKHWTLHAAADADVDHAAPAAEPGPGSVPAVSAGPVVPSPTRIVAPATPATAAANGVIPPDTPTTAAAARHLARVPLLTRDWLHRVIPLGFTNALLVVGARVAHVTVRRAGVVPAAAPPIPMSVSDAIVAMIAHTETAGPTTPLDVDDVPPADRILGTHTQPLRPGHTVAATVAVKPSNLSAKYATRAAHLGIALAPTKYEIEVVVSRVVHSGPPRPLPLPPGAVVELPAAPTDPARASRKRLRPHVMSGEVVGPAPPSLTAAALGPPPPRPRLEPAVDGDADEGPIPPPPRKRSKHRHETTAFADPVPPPPVPPLPPSPPPPRRRSRPTPISTAAVSSTPPSPTHSPGAEPPSPPGPTASPHGNSSALPRAQTWPPPLLPTPASSSDDLPEPRMGRADERAPTPRRRRRRHTGWWPRVTENLSAWCHDTLRVVTVIRRVLETPVPLDVPSWSDHGEDEPHAHNGS